MATQKSTTAQKSAGRRPGRPSNASKAAAQQSHNALIINAAMAAASAAVNAAFGIVEGGVTTIAQPQGGQSVGSTSQGSGTQSTPQGTQSTRTTSRSSGQGRKAPGRKVDGTSNMSLTRQFYAENLKSANPLNRADFVRAAAEKFNYNKQIANTYVSNIEKEGGYLLQRRGGNSASRTPSKRRTSAKGSNQTQNQTQAQAA